MTRLGPPWYDCISKNAQHQHQQRKGSLMKRDDLTVGMTVENKYGDRYRVVSTDGWIYDHDGRWDRSPDTGLTVDGHPVYGSVRRANKGERTSCVLLVPEVQLGWVSDGVGVSGVAKQPRYLHPEGTYTGPREEAVPPLVVVTGVSLSAVIAAAAKMEAAND